MHTPTFKLFTKDEVRQIAHKYDCTTRYAGEDKVMYIIGLNDTTCAEFIKSYGRDCNFKVVAQSTITSDLRKKHARGR